MAKNMFGTSKGKSDLSIDIGGKKFDLHDLIEQILLKIQSGEFEIPNLHAADAAVFKRAATILDSDHGTTEADLEDTTTDAAAPETVADEAATEEPSISEAEVVPAPTTPDTDDTDTSGVEAPDVASVPVETTSDDSADLETASPATSDLTTSGAALETGDTAVTTILPPDEETTSTTVEETLVSTTSHEEEVKPTAVDPDVAATDQSASETSQPSVTAESEDVVAEADGTGTKETTTDDVAPVAVDPTNADSPEVVETVMTEDSSDQGAAAPTATADDVAGSQNPLASWLADQAALCFENAPGTTDVGSEALAVQYAGDIADILGDLQACLAEHETSANLAAVDTVSDYLTELQAKVSSASDLLC